MVCSLFLFYCQHAFCGVCFVLALLSDELELMSSERIACKLSNKLSCTWKGKCNVELTIFVVLCI